jgi:2,3-bisphosphoglycerate-independent phosphoglycerate mutase
MPTPHVLIILDGWGHRPAASDNAISLAKTPVWDRIWDTRPHCLVSASGGDVGLPSGQMGNSEVGHMNLGTGRIADQDFTRINNAIEDRSFFDNNELTRLNQALADSGKALHILGLLSPGGVHSHENQLKAAVDLAFSSGVKQVYVHAFLDGRDVPPSSAEPSLVGMNEHIRQSGRGGIASIVGRFYAMDRDQRWQRVERAYNLINGIKADYIADSATQGLQAAYDRGETDEFVQPTQVMIDGQTVGIEDGDGVLFMNFRSDRARELTRSFIDSDFDAFERQARPALCGFVTLTRYADDLEAPCAFGPLVLTNGLGEYLSSLGKSQLRIAETEKYAHVTFFFSGGREEPFPGEERILIASPKVATYDLQPTMSAVEVTDRLVDDILNERHDLVVCNYANGDMVGHTGKLDAAIKAVECVDECLGRVLTAVQQVQGHCLVTADHGNVEQMTDVTTGQPHTAHTSELVPLIYIGEHKVQLHSGNSCLRDIAPTLLDLMSLTPPVEMTGTSLLREVPVRVAS